MMHKHPPHVGRTEPNLDDLGLTFQDLNVHLEDLSEYVQNVDPLPFVAEVPKFPIPKESLLVFPKPDSREVREREEHIDDYLPPMHPEWEEVQSSEPEDCTPSAEDPGDDDSSVVDVDVLSIVPPGAGAEAHDPSATPHNGKKRPHTSPETEQSPDKRARYLPDMAAPHCYKMMSVVMSHSGVLTPTLGIGRLPNARTPPRPPPSPPPKFTHKSQFWPASAKTSDKGQGKVKIKSVKPTVLNPIKKSFKLPKDSDNSKNKDLKRDKSKSKKISSKSKSKKSTKENTSSTALSMLEPKIYKKKKKSQDKKMKGSENSSSGKLKLLLTTRTSKSIGDAPNKNTLEHTPPRKNPLAMASSLALAASGLTTPVSPARSTSSALMNMRTPSPQKIKPISVTTPGSPLIMVDDSDDSDAACPSTPILVEAEEMSMERRTRLDSYTATIEEVVNYSQGIGEEVSISETMEEGEVNHSEIIEEGVNFSETIEEEVNILDTIEEEDNMPGTIEEEVNFSETIEEEEIDILNTIEEEDNFSETVEEEVNLSETIEEEVNFQETMEEEVNFSETVDQEVDISETIEEEVNNSETISEEITISETIEEEVIFSEAIEEEVNICETIEEEVNFSETIEEEVISYSDTVEAVVDSDNIEDVLKVSETAEVLDVLDTVEEVVSYPETIEEVVTYSETVEEVVSYSDTAEEVVSYSENVEDVREEVVAHTEDAEQENVRDSEGEERRKENERLEQELHAEFKTEAEVDKERLQQKFDNAIDGDVGQQVIKPTDSDDRDDGKLTTALGNLKCIPPSPTVSSEQRKVHKMLKTQKSSKLSKGPKGITGMKPLHVQASKNEGGGDAITDSKKDVMKRLKEKIKPKTSDYKSSQGKSVTGLAVTHVKKKPHDGSSSPAITSDRRTSSVQSTQLSIGKVELAEERKLEKETDKEKGKDKEHKKDKKKKKKKDKDKDKSEIIEDKSEKKDKKDKKEKSKKDKKEKKDKKSDKDKECKKDKSTDPVIPRLKFKFGSSGSGSSVIPSVNMFASPQQAVAGSLKVSPHIKTHSSCKAPVSSPQASTVPKLSIKLPSPAKALIPSPILVQSRSRSESRSPSPPYGSRSPRSLHSQYDPQYTFPPHPAPHSKTPISESSLTNPTSPKQSMARTWMASWQTHSPSPPRTPGPFGMPSPMSSTSRSPSPPPQPSRMVSASFLPPPPSSSAKKAAAKMAAAERAAAERMSAERAEAAARLTVEHAAAQKSAKAAAAKILANKSKNSPATGKVKKVSSKKGEPSTPGQSPGALPRQSSAVSPAVPLRQVPAVPIQQPAAALSRQSLPSMSGTTGVISETVGTIIDEHGQTIWICPACKRQDDGSPMIGCDDCDDWFHWVCVGLVVPPPDDKQWYCLQCNTNRLIKNAGKKKKRRKKMK